MRSIDLLAGTTILSMTLGCAMAQTTSSPAPTPSPQPKLVYDADFFGGLAHDQDIPTPRELLGFEVGQRAATHAEIEACFKAWDSASDRTRMFDYARSYEDRSLYYMAISSPENIDRLDEIKSNMAKLADPRSIDAAEADRLLANTPAVAWMAYAIHGDETSGADAAVAAAYHLSACIEPDVTEMLDDLVIIIDPLMNPDGRDRFLKMLREHRGNVPNVDAQSMLHTGYWPWGRTNHYLFDLNRDWILGVHPESRGRIAASGAWHPLLFVDAHEMGSLDTYLFSPSRPPVNSYLPERRKHWWDVFATDQAHAFDQFDWPYYTGEWNEEWYPGYSSSWAGFRGAVGILYEQAGIAEDAVARPEGTQLTFRQSVHHQYVSTMANLKTLHANHEDLMREFVEERRNSVSADGPFADMTFAITPTGNQTRLEQFLSLMQVQGIEVYQATRDFSAPATDQLGVAHDDMAFGPGTLLIPARQPEGPLVAAMLSFDMKMPESFLVKERRELLRFGRSLLYDVTAWNMTMMHDVMAHQLSSGLPDGAVLYEASARQGNVTAADGGDTTLWVIDGRDDASVACAAHLMERGLRVRVADKEFNFDGRSFPRGSVVVTRNDNPGEPGPLVEHIAAVCDEFRIEAIGIASGLGKGVEVPDIGGEHFVLMEKPRIALLSRGLLNAYSYGAAWHALDHRLGVRTSQLDVAQASFGGDLRQYNVIIVPDSWGPSPVASLRERLKPWVEQGGTLIAIGSSAAAAANKDAGMGQVRLLQDVLGDLGEYELSVLREYRGRNETLDMEALWSHAPSEAIDYPWESAGAPLSGDEAKKRDAWQRVFMPQGVMLAGRVDDKSWLTFGLRDFVPTLFGGSTVLMSKTGAEAPVRLGVWAEAAEEESPALETEGDEVVEGESESDSESESAPAPPARIGWTTPPAGVELQLRMSGLLWPEAAHRLANSAFVTRERVGRGQVILFAGDPVFRGSTMGTGRVFINAAIYGPGFGASHPIRPDRRH